MKTARRTLSEKGKRDVARVHDSFQCSERHCGRVEKRSTIGGWMAKSMGILLFSNLI